MPAIPDSLRENLAYGLGDTEAERWLDDAIGRAEALFDAWDLVPELVLPGGSESLCVKCAGPDGECVLKLPASVSGGAAEIAALRAWAGDGAARVLRAESEHNAVLMDFLGWVGVGSYTLPDVLDLVARLHSADPAPHVFPVLEANIARRVTWARERFGATETSHDDEALRDVDVAAKFLQELMPPAPDDSWALLHGDLQPKNLIVSPAGLAVVDPLPSVGPAIFDIALYVVKSTSSDTLDDCQREVLALRPDLDADLLRRWCWALAVLESRPYLGDVNTRRTSYIQDWRGRV